MSEHAESISNVWLKHWVIKLNDRAMSTEWFLMKQWTLKVAVWVMSTLLDKLWSGLVILIWYFCFYQGNRLLDGATKEMYEIDVGLTGKCFIEEINNFNITCSPPPTKPRTNHSDENVALVVVSINN